MHVYVYNVYIICIDRIVVAAGKKKGWIYCWVNLLDFDRENPEILSAALEVTEY